MGWRGCVRCWAALACLCGVAGQAQEPVSSAVSSAAAWKQAVAARAAFEEEPVGQHTKIKYAGVMNGFRAIYHGNPGDLYAPRAVDAVAELLAEEGRELKDRKALRDAAGQYEFLAKAYPASSLAAPGLAKALDLLGPDGAGDVAEAGKVRTWLGESYPKSAAARGAGDVGMVGKRTDPVGTAEVRGAPDDGRVPGGVTTRKTAIMAEPGATPRAESSGGVQERRSPGGMTTKGTAPSFSDRMAVESSPVSDAVDDQRRVPGAAPAMVTGIRHWSTASYTRVAIDLGGEVEFKAARVEHPDRIFFDLHGAKLAPGLMGKSFAITDDGFLKMIRAGQSAADVTRIVLDVQAVAEYSAFLLPNPTRLIIDIHGKPAGEQLSGAASAQVAGPADGAVNAPVGKPTSDLAAARATSGRSDGPHGIEKAAAPGESLTTNTTRLAERPSAGDAGSPSKVGGGEFSSLPPMPVTDGSSSFGLPAKRTEPVTTNQPVARPRVVVSAKPTVAKPVPNSVTSAAPEGNREIAAVSDGPGVIEATAKPTSKPVVDRAKGRDQGVGNKGQGAAVGAQPASRGAEVAGVPAAPPPPTADGQSTLMRALGLKIGRIVIDAGHGGHDSGTLGADGIQEKDVVLDVALRLGKLLHDRLGAEIVYTRADDTFIPLETRTAIANKAQADLFISVHANSSGDASARGVEVYYLNFTSDPEAMQVAGRENAVSSQRVNQLSDLVKKIALKDKIDESRELASDVDTSLYAGLKKGNEGLKDRGVKKAPFVVLIGANMPSILAEISFVTNPDDAQELNRPAYRERVAESLYAGVARYAGAINGRPGGSKTKPRTTERAER